MQLGNCSVGEKDDRELARRNFRFRERERRGVRIEQRSMLGFAGFAGTIQR
jgi:hypothetical protein